MTGQALRVQGSGGGGVLGRPILGDGRAPTAMLLGLILSQVCQILQDKRQHHTHAYQGLWDPH